MKTTVFSKIRYIPRFPLILICIIAVYGITILYSVNSGHFYPWGVNQIIRLFIGLGFLLTASIIPLSFWKRYAYLFYIIGIILLICVITIGKVSMGAQRWINMYSFNFQPSEMMRIFLVLALAKYFAYRTTAEIKHTLFLTAPLCIISIPMTLVLMQPDLGTAMIFCCIGISLFFVCGVQLWKFAAAFGAVLISAPILWNMLYNYQKDRILIFFSPEKDPSGAGYHIIQSQIALGSGGFCGKGLLNGTQCQLNFLPEKQTDFVFAALGEELGFMGCVFLVLLYCLLIVYNFNVALQQKYKFQQIVIFGLNAMLFFYIFINIAMVCGMLPVVGIPLPFFSYGGSAMVALMFCQGIIFSADIEQRKPF